MKRFANLRQDLNESRGDEIITHSANYKSPDHEAVKGHIKSLTSEYKELKIKHEPYGRTGHKLTYTGPRYLVHRAHNIMSQFNTSSKSQHDWFAQKGRERGKMNESYSPTRNSRDVVDTLKRHASEFSKGKMTRENMEKEWKAKDHTPEDMIRGAYNFCSIHNPKEDSFAHGIIRSGTLDNRSPGHIHKFMSELAERSGRKLNEAMIPAGKAKGKLRRYAKMRSASAAVATGPDAVGNFVVPTLIGGSVGHPGIGAAVGTIAAARSAIKNIKKSHRFGKIAKRLDRERKRK